jgi:hypothetical protein
MQIFLTSFSTSSHIRPEFKNLWKKNNSSEYHIENWIFMESVVFLLFLSLIIAMLRGTNQETWIQKVNLGFLLTESMHKKPQH